MCCLKYYKNGLFILLGLVQTVVSNLTTSFFLEYVSQTPFRVDCFRTCMFSETGMRTILFKAAV